MKKLLSGLILTVLLLSLLNSCSPSESTNSNSSNESQSQNTATGSEASGDSTAVTTQKAVPLSADSPAKGYSGYLEVKSDALEKILNAASVDEQTNLTISQGVLPVSMSDLSLLFLTVLDNQDSLVTEKALNFLGLNNVSIKREDMGYTITYDNPEGKSFVLTCLYDSPNDRLHAELKDGQGKTVLYFDYIKVGSAYVSQTYFDTGENYYLVKGYFDKDTVAAFGIEESLTIPASLWEQEDLTPDFVKNGSLYVILQQGTLIYGNRSKEMIFQTREN